jgi:hypothetical protein
MSRAYGYQGNHLKWSHLEGENETEIVPQIEEKNQFALEMDHFAECILEGKIPTLRVKNGSKITGSWKQFTNPREPAELSVRLVDSLVECPLQLPSY